VSAARRATVVIQGSPPKNAGLVLAPGGNLRWGGSGFKEKFGTLTSLEEDLLILSSAIYGCDLAFKRGERENITRNIALRVPVTNFQAFERVHGDLEHILYVLSHDNWTVEFARRGGSPESAATWSKQQGKTLLFSGGLDSLAAAVELLDQIGPAHLQLASHVTGNQLTRGTQEKLVEYLNSKYQPQVNRIALRTGGHKHKDFPFPSDQDREETQRTRSFMFLAIGSLAARRSGQSEVVMIAENGQMAIHLPLSAARIGAFSTHTAHPQFVDLASDFFSKVLDYQIQISNPYLYRTKAEVVKGLVAKHPTAIGISVSCWRGSRVSGSNHCGECVPCLVRRVAVEANGLKLPEYARDLLAEDVSNLPEDNEGKRNLVEFGEFASAFKRLPQAELQFMYPDLFSAHFDTDAAVKMYKRFADEALTVLSSYPRVKALFDPNTAGGAKASPVSKKRPGGEK
jgi:7-cyano-7-deazaguanine synthase in queuosine biosynthesis